MNCTYFQRQLLLLDSGEMGRRRKVRLVGHLEQCPACLDFVRTLSFLRDAAGRPVYSPDTPQATIEALLQAAQLESKARTLRFSIRPAPALGLAASVLLALGLAVWGLRSLSDAGNGMPETAAGVTAWTDEVDLSLETVETELAGVQYEIDSITEAEDLAREILSMEGEKT